jgi:hypothetical protein
LLGLRYVAVGGPMAYWIATPSEPVCARSIGAQTDVWAMYLAALRPFS